MRTKGTATLNAFVRRIRPNLPLHHCVSQKWFNTPYAATKLDEAPKTYFTPLLLFCSTSKAEIITITALYLLWELEESRKPKRRRVWVHDILRRRSQLGEFHHLLQELRLDDGRFQTYFQLTGAMFDDLLTRVGARIYRQDTKYRRSTSAEERLSSVSLPVTSGQAQR